jgi:hypothetical protein
MKFAPSKDHYVVLLVVAGLAGCTDSGQFVDESVSVVREALTGSWTKIGSTFPGAGHPGNVALLTDGRLLCSGPETSTSWWTLTADSFGSYANGTWQQVGSSSLGRLFNLSFVTQDGRYWECGGEYVTGVNCDASPGSPACAECEIFDPVTNSWASAPSMPEPVSDTAGAIMGDGRILVLSQVSSNDYLFNPAAASGWIAAAAWDRVTIDPAVDNESGSLLLPDGSVLVGLQGFERYLPTTNTWVSVAPTPGVPSREFTSGDEIGPFELLYDGRVLILGGNTHNGLYTPPSTLTGAGSWTLAMDTPVGPDPTKPLNHGDTPAVVEPSGVVLTAGSQDQSGVGASDPFLYEYTPDTGAGTWASVPNPGNVQIDDTDERLRLLDLPSGQIFLSGYSDGSMWLYSPAGGPNSSWRPTISFVGPKIFGEYWLTGTQLNGLTTGGDFGDDSKLATNYPLVSLIDGAGHVTYARTHDFDTMIPRPGTVGNFRFAVPTSLTPGTYTIRVAANGVSSASSTTATVGGPDLGFAWLTSVMAL